MKLMLVRHGESARNRGYEVSNQDNNLTAEGVSQAIELAKLLAKKKIDAIYCSPAARCQQTLEEILRIRIDKIPIHMCKLVGQKIKSESFEKLKRRVVGFVDDLKYDHKDSETVLIIGHQLSLGMTTYVINGKIKVFKNGELFEVVL